jgi:hypothetical protein
MPSEFDRLYLDSMDQRERREVFTYVLAFAVALVGAILMIIEVVRLATRECLWAGNCGWNFRFVRTRSERD